MSASPGKGQGRSPAKTTSSTSSSSMAGTSSSGASPFKTASSVKSKRDDDDSDDAAEEMDTRSLLERMKETVEGMKKRRSLAPATPVRGPVTPARTPGMGFSRPGIVSPSKGMRPMMTEVAEEEEEEDKENAMGADEGRKEEEVFSLLRPGVLEEVRAREEESIVEVEEELLQDSARVDEDGDVEMADEEPKTHPSAFDMPAATESPTEVDATPPVNGISSADEEAANVPVPKKSGRARLLRAKKPAPATQEEDVDEEPADQPVSLSLVAHREVELMDFDRSQRADRRPRGERPRRPLRNQSSRRSRITLKMSISPMHRQKPPRQPRAADVKQLLRLQATPKLSRPQLDGVVKQPLPNQKRFQLLPSLNVGVRLPLSLRTHLQRKRLQYLLPLVVDVKQRVLLLFPQKRQKKRILSRWFLRLSSGVCARLPLL